jgi:outer membrane protein assembly factor BamB
MAGRLAAAGLILAAGALASCGTGRPLPQPTLPTTAPAPPSTAVAPPPAQSAALPWPMYGVGGARVRAVSAPRLRPPFRRQWTFHGRALLEFPPVLGYGGLFEEAFDGRLFALDARTGRLRWRDIGFGNFYSTAAVSSGRVYVGSLDGYVYAFSAASGELVWRLGTRGYVYASPAVWRGLVLVGSYDHDFYAIDAGSGSLRWAFHAGAPISGAASVVGGLVYFSSFGHRTYALSAGSGRVVQEWPDGEYSPAVAGFGRLYLVGLGRIYALAPR